MNLSKKIIATCLSLSLAVGLFACTNTPESSNNESLKKVDFILDWTPNTNHTGLFVAKEKGYLKEVGIDLDIKQPSEDSTSDLIINNKAPFGIYFQDTMASKLSKNAPITAVAAIIEHNTSGIVSAKDKNILSPKDMVNKTYGTWNDPVELAMIESLMKKENADFKKVTLVPNSDSNSISAIENGLFDSAWIYYGWDGYLAESLGIKTNFFYLKDFDKALDFYSPIIIANNDYLKENKDEAKAILNAIKKGYQYAIDHPQEAAEILIKHVPELKEKSEFIKASQTYLSKHYAEDKATWGKIDPKRWNDFYTWVNKNKITQTPIEMNAGFSNEYLD